ncbi:MAG: hypothetical protein FWC14_01000 [Candidatus Bathyarchaeota archaeon]|uniref:hypothetical protein n=1 Tax=Candidatus Bathycorpusculum sp. TaxID=2994959 RepID=UPI00282FC418|nr:hypothetical protein [Candidatus Termiticorpusculum sp.]MCL2293161.1 hypothetical protein [Candidatus Termiticorpusculum sp.]
MSSDVFRNDKIGDEGKLRAAIDTAVGPTVITLNKDLTLKDPLVINNGKNITLTSNSDNAFFKLFFVTNPRAITVNTGGVLILDGVIITRDSNSIGSGVTVSLGGTFIMIDGEISGHTAPTAGGGVFNAGTFSMLGGVITKNTAGMHGGGVANSGTFTMSGGVISDNFAPERGGGVDNYGGAGIVFEMSGGVITNNEAYKGGGVYHHSQGSFNLSAKGVISNNIADIGGGVCMDGNFDMNGGEISGNVARNQGGGLYNGYGIFLLTDGKIFDNTAAQEGGGLYTENGEFRLSGGKILGNAAGTDGGGVWIATKNFGKLYVYNGVEFKNNRASVAYNRLDGHAALYHRQIGNRVTWTDPFTQGYNNYDISYTRGQKIS